MCAVQTCDDTNLTRLTRSSSPFVLYPQLVLFHLRCHTIVPCLLHNQVPLLIAHKCLRPETRGLPTHRQPIPQAGQWHAPVQLENICRPTPHTSCTAPRGFCPMSLLGWKGISTAYRLHEVSFSCVPSSHLSLKDAALHSSISPFTLGIYHRMSPHLYRPPSYTRSLSRNLLQLSKFSLHFGHLFPSLSSSCLHSPSLSRFISPLFPTGT